ncbi:hypothetical protein IFM89_001358 [Coptis chinensis]|uniref:Uncharacterized protein n=1 Tax=Coptis chinensis TaxID=261450 RepID=A0A835HBV2_9MAGN|nr:hypothetical protein IFM89_001358 [Coptis chinensis]
MQFEDISLDEVGSDCSSIEEAGSNDSPSSATMVKEGSGKEQKRAFGINDILLLRKITRYWMLSSVGVLLCRIYEELFCNTLRLIAFSAYIPWKVGIEAFDGFCGQGEWRITFKTWLHQRPKVQTMKWSIRLCPGRFFTVPKELITALESQNGDAVMEATVIMVLFWGKSPY